MNLKMSHVDMWTVDLDDQPGALARTLRAIADYGADLDYVVARRLPDKPGKGVLYVSPLTGKEQLDRSGQAGLRRATEIPTLKIEGTDAPGTGAKLTNAIAGAGVNLNGLSTVVFGRRFVCYAGFDTVADRDKAQVVLQALNTPHWHFWHRRAATKAA